MIRVCARILLAALTCFSLRAGAVAGGGALPALVDLHRDASQAQREGKPIILLFSLPGCSFCHVVRQNYLLPLLKDPADTDRPIIREVDITGARNVVSFDRAPANHRSVAKDFNVQVAPTVLFLDASGRPLTQPIVGGDIAGLYGGYLDNAFAEAAQKLSAARRSDKKGDKP
jgi:thioredoxin-related protein